MTKIAIIVGGVVLMAGVALAGTLTSLGSTSTPAGQTISPPAKINDIGEVHRILPAD